MKIGATMGGPQPLLLGILIVGAMTNAVVPLQAFVVPSSSIVSLSSRSYRCVTTTSIATTIATTTTTTEPWLSKVVVALLGSRSNHHHTHDEDEPLEADAVFKGRGFSGGNVDGTEGTVRSFAASHRMRLRWRLSRLPPRVRTWAAVVVVLTLWVTNRVPAHASAKMPPTQFKILEQPGRFAAATTTRNKVSSSDASTSSNLRLLTGSGVILGTVMVGAGKVRERNRNNSQEQMEDLEEQESAFLDTSEVATLETNVAATNEQDNTVVDAIDAVEWEANEAVEQAKASMLHQEQKQDPVLFLQDEELLAHATASIFDATAEQVVTEVVIEEEQQERAVAVATTTAPTTTLQVNANENVKINVPDVTVAAAATTLVMEKPSEPIVDAAVGNNDDDDHVDTTNGHSSIPTELHQNGIEQSNELPKVLHTLLENAAHKYHNDNEDAITTNLFSTDAVQDDSKEKLTLAKMDETNAITSSSSNDDDDATKKGNGSSRVALAKEKITQFFQSNNKKRDEMSSKDEDEESSLFPDTLAKKPKDSFPAISKMIANARQQPKAPAEEARLQAKYAAIESLEERAYTILVDLGMVQVTSPLDVTEWA